MSRGSGRYRLPSGSHDSSFTRHPHNPRQRERDRPPQRHHERSSPSAERERQDHHRRTYSSPAPIRGRGGQQLHYRSEPRPEPAPDRRENRSAGPLAFGSSFDNANRSNMFQLKVVNLALNRMHMDERQLRKSLFQVFTRFGKCSVYVDCPSRNDDVREAYVTYWNLAHAKTARRDMQDRTFHNRRLDISLMTKPRIFGQSMDNNRQWNNANFVPTGRPGLRQDDGGGGGHQAGPMRQQSLLDCGPDTRTLYVGNLPSGVPVSEVREHFGNIGEVHDIDVKRPQNAPHFGFVKFVHMRDARRAKLELQGSLLRKTRLRLNFSRGTPSSRLYVYNLGRWATKGALEQCFARYGTVCSLDYRAGSAFAIVEYTQMEAARVVMHEQVRVAADGVEHPVAVSYVDAMDLSVAFVADARAGGGGGGLLDHQPGTMLGNGHHHHRQPPHDHRSSSRGREAGQAPVRDYWHSDERTRSKRGRSAERADDAKRLFAGGAPAESLADVTGRCVVAWRGCLVLRDACCPVRLHHVGGDATVAERSLAALGMPRVALSKRLQMDAPRLASLMRSLAADGSRHCWLLAMPTLTGETDALRTRLGTADGDRRTPRSVEPAPPMSAERSQTAVVANADATGAAVAVSPASQRRTESVPVEEPSEISVGESEQPGSEAGGDGKPVLDAGSGSDMDLANDGMSDSGCGVVVEEACRVPLWRHMRNFANYMRAKQCAGVAHIMSSDDSGATQLTAILHAFPPSDFADRQLGDLCPRLSCPVDGVLLVLLVLRATLPTP